MKNFEIKNLSDPTTDESAVNKKWVTDHVSGSSLTSSGFTMTGNIDMGGHSITGLAGLPHPYQPHPYPSTRIRTTY